MEILAVSLGGGAFLIDVGRRGDALGQYDVPLGRVYASGRLGKEDLPISSIAAHGFWAAPSTVYPEILDRVRGEVAALLAAD